MYLPVPLMHVLALYMHAHVRAHPQTHMHAKRPAFLKKQGAKFVESKAVQRKRASMCMCVSMDAFYLGLWRLRLSALAYFLLPDL